MKKIIAILLIFLSPLVFAGSATHFELKVFDIKGKPVETVIKVRHGLIPVYNPKIVVEAEQSGKISVKEKESKLFELEINNSNDLDYEYSFTAYDDGEKLSDTGEKKRFKKSNKLIFIADVAEEKYLVELFANNLKSGAKVEAELKSSDIVAEEPGCGYVSVRKPTYKRNHYQAIIREIDNDLKIGTAGEFKVSAGIHELLIYASVPETLSSRKNKQLEKGALTRFKVMPNKIYYISAYYNKSELDKSGGYLWQPVVIDTQDKECK